MTHNDIYTKFMIEYDKANITSSYPSLTKYEVATLLDKAYLALISQKLTGNNVRKVGFESDVKSIEDLRHIIKTDTLSSYKSTTDAINEITFDIRTTSKQFMYYVAAQLETEPESKSTDDYYHNRATVELINHIAAESFKVTSTNMPWVKHPMAYMQGDYIHVLVDPYKKHADTDGILHLTYIFQPTKFVDTKFDNTLLELSDTFAEELINQAIIFATEITEAPRLTTKVQTSTYES